MFTGPVHEMVRLCLSQGEGWFFLSTVCWVLVSLEVLTKIQTNLTISIIRGREMKFPPPLAFSLPMMNDLPTLKLILGLCLFLAGVLLFSIWKDRLFALKDEERVRFLMFNVLGGSWVLAVFAVCGGIYFLFDSVFRFQS